MIRAALPWTLGLVGMATLISFALGTLLGVLVAWRRGTWLDNLLPVTTFLQAAPYFFLAFLVIDLFSTKLGWFPSGGGRQNLDFPALDWTYLSDVLDHAVLPALTIVVASAAGWIVGMRNVMITTMDEDYVLIGAAKGLSRRRVVWYAARNAILPSVSGFSLAIGFIVSGALLTEIVFSYPGLGLLLVNGVEDSDYALLQGIFLIITLRGAGREPAGRLRLRVPRPAYPAGGLNMTAGTSVAQGDLPSPALPTGTDGPAPARHPAAAIAEDPDRPGAAAGLRGAGHRGPAGWPPTTRTPSFHNSPVPLAPSAAHWLGTTALQQDVFSQLLSGGRSTFLVAFLAGLVATALSVVIGVTAGYLGGLADDLLSMLANIFLVMPALPLLIILFGFLRSSGSNDDLIIGLIDRGHRLGLGRPGAARADAVAAQPGLRRLGPDHRRARLADHHGRDPAEPDPGGGLVVPVHGAVRGRHLHRAGLPGAGQSR